MSLTPQQLSSLPDDAGVYLFKDTTGQLLYIGKAKKLSQRVKSYWQKSSELSPAKLRMVKKIAVIDYILVATESDALLLEATLIHKHKPPFNIELKDDKSWLYIRVTNESYPRIQALRRPSLNGGLVFGPYTSPRAVRQTIRLLRNLFPYPSCNIIRDGRCLEYDRGRSIGPARGGVPLEEYQKIIREAVAFLRGRYQGVARQLEQAMRTASEREDFERAAVLRDQLQAIQVLMTKQQVVALGSDDADVMALARGLDRAMITVARVRRGTFLSQDTFTLLCEPEEKAEDILEAFAQQFYLGVRDLPKEIVIARTLPNQSNIVTFLKKVSGKNIRLVVGQRGWRHQLLKIARLNAEHALDMSLASWQKDEHFAAIARKELVEVLSLSGHLKRIETYDISNIQGRQAVGSMVVFTDGLPDKKAYRKFRIQTIFQSDDFSMLQEVMTRRLKHQHDWGRPDLLVIDGGKGQLNAVREVLRLRGLEIPIIGLAKKQEEIFIPDQSELILLEKTSYALRLLQRMRDEAHRFAITFHRDKHREVQIQSRLDDIPGIGPRRRKKLLRAFGSIKKIREADVDALAEVVGMEVAKMVKKYIG